MGFLRIELRNKPHWVCFGLTQKCNEYGGKLKPIISVVCRHNHVKYLSALFTKVLHIKSFVCAILGSISIELGGISIGLTHSEVANVAKTEIINRRR